MGMFEAGEISHTTDGPVGKGAMIQATVPAAVATTAVTPRSAETDRLADTLLIGRRAVKVDGDVLALPGLHVQACHPVPDRRWFLVREADSRVAQEPPG
jgi:hypothetical protein